MSELNEQLEINLKINQLIKERSKFLDKQNNLLVDQISLQKAMCEALECADIEKINKSFRETKESLDALIKETEKLDRSSNQFNKVKKSAAGMSTGIIASKGAWTFLSKAVIGVGSTIRAFGKGLSSIVGLLGKVAKAIIAVPFKSLEVLIQMANIFAKFTEFDKALENIREKFGDLNKGTGQILKESIRPMGREMGQLAAAGHGFTATFGRGPAGVARALEFNAELMEKLNGGTEQLRKEIGENIAAMAIYRKGMGFTAEQQAILIRLSNAQGKSITEVQHSYAKFSLEMGKRFGLDSKLIGSAMAEMTANVGDFGTLSTRELAQVATYTQKLGIQTKALQGVIRKYDDFESAAKSAAMLNQTFGMQIDVMKMLKEEDPAARLSELQKSFQATGKSYDQLSRAERRRLAELAGLDDESAALAFSQKGLSMSYEEVQAAGEETEVGFKDINETIKELSRNMKKMLEDPEEYQSFFAAFTRGFQKGFIASEPFMRLMRNLRSSLFAVEQAGKQVGRAFVEMFPGVKDVIEGLNDFFNPATIRSRMNNIVESFKTFFTALQKGPVEGRKALGQLFEDLSNNFTNFFGGQSGATSRISEGLKDFGRAILRIAAGLFENVIQGLTKFLSTMSIFFENLSEGKSLQESISNAFEGATEEGSFLSRIMSTLSEEFAGIGSLITENLLPALKSAFSNMWNYLKPYIIEGIKDMALSLISAWWSTVKSEWSEGSKLLSAGLFLAPFLLILGPGPMFALGKLAITGLTKGLVANTPEVAKAAAGATKPLTAGSPLLTKISAGLTRFGSMALRLVGGPWGLAAMAVIDAGRRTSQHMENLGEEAIEKYGANATKAAAGLAGVLDAITLGLLPDDLSNKMAERFANFLGGGEQGFIVGFFKRNISQTLAIVSDLFMGVWGAIKGIWDLIVGLLTGDWERAGLGVSKFLGAIVNTIVQIFSTAVTGIIDQISRVIDFLKGAVDKVAEFLNIPVPQSIQKAFDGAAAAAGAVGSWIQRGTAAVGDFTSDLSEARSQRQMARDTQETVAQESEQQATTRPELEDPRARLNELQAVNRMLTEIEDLQGIEVKLDDAIRQMPTGDKIDLIKKQTGELVINLNNIFAALHSELNKVEINEELEKNIFDNNIMQNISNIIVLKENIEKIAERGANSGKVTTEINKLVTSLKVLQGKSQEINECLDAIGDSFGEDSEV
jgi:hypothetical protein